MPKNKVYIIGVVESNKETLSAHAHQLISESEILFGGERLLRMFPPSQERRVVVGHNLAEIADIIKTNLGQKHMVILASGDPNFYGTAKFMIDKLGKDVFEVIPNVSSMQLAFARIKESWDDAAFVSVHSRPIEDIVEIVRSNYKVCVFTDSEHTPAAIARVLVAQGVDNYQAYVCQNLGGDDEKVVKANLRRLCDMEFSPLNVLVLLRVQQKKVEDDLPSRIFGIPDEEFHRRKSRAGLITKLEVRAVSLAKMCLREDSVVWDIGAGSGAISIEASLLAKKGHIYSIEKNTSDVSVIKKNLQKFHAQNVEIIQSFAPDGLGDLPAPNIVFIGGSSGKLKEILDVVCHRLKPGGNIVVNVVSIENLSVAINTIEANNFMADITLINAARSTHIMELSRLQAMNPVFIVKGIRRTETEG